MAGELLYIHGFISSPQSAKAQLTRHYLQSLPHPVRCTVPALPSTPLASWRLLEHCVAEASGRGERLALVGSSLGGFFATALAEKYDLRAVLINPAVRPHRLMRHFLGRNHNPYTGESFDITPAHMDELAGLEPAAVTPERYWVLVQAGDETLDYRDAQSYYSACKMTVEPGGDHSFQGFERYLPDIAGFLQLI